MNVRLGRRLMLLAALLVATSATARADDEGQTQQPAQATTAQQKAIEAKRLAKQAAALAQDKRPSWLLRAKPTRPPRLQARARPMPRARKSGRRETAKCGSRTATANPRMRPPRLLAGAPSHNLANRATSKSASKTTKRRRRRMTSRPPPRLIGLLPSRQLNTARRTAK